MLTNSIHIRTIFLALVLVCVCTRIHAQTGSDCSNPIVLADGYHANITSAGSKWYIANTFDLPMAIDFYPSNFNSAAPELELDFGCTPGVYEDSILCSLFCKANSAYISLPHKETPPKSYDAQGNVRYHVEFGEFYRDMLLRQGIDYNIPVYIKVTYHGTGTLQMEPDPFNNCMDGPKFMHLGDTVNVIAQDVNRHVIVPYVQWQYDSIRYVWTGTTPCTIAIGNSCGFNPTDAEDAAIMDIGVIQPGGQFKVSSALLMQYVSDQVNYPNEAGMYFAKFYSDAPGVMKIEKIPAPAPQSGAVLLKYGVETPIGRKDTTTVYAIPDSWIKAMQFITPTDHIFKMYIGQTPDFYTTDAVATYQFDRTNEGHQLCLFANDMAAIWENKLDGEHYLYVRFECSENTTVTPSLWTPSDCVKKASRIEADEQFDVSAKSNAIFSLFYADWKGGDMTIAWTSTQATCSFYIADTCDIPNSNVSPVFYTDKAPKKGSITIPMATVDSWEPNVDPDGYLYIRFYSQGKGKITVTTSAPEEEEPACSSVDSVLSVTEWDSYEWFGTRYTTSGVYHRDGNLDPETGCVDTVFTLNLTIHTTSQDSYSEIGCDSIWYNKKKYTESGIYIDTVYDAGGDRTVMILNLTVNYSNSGEETKEACGSYVWHNQTYSLSGDYPFHLTNAAGCDSTATLHLTIKQPTSSEDTKSACGSYIWNEQTYTTSGDYTFHTTNAAGCDSTATLHLTIKQPTSSEDTKSACGSYIWNEQTYTTSGDYTFHTTNAAGCDSTATLHLTIKQPTSSEDTKEACGSYIWNEQTYTTSGDYTFHTTNAAGCDSTATLHLTIKQPTSSEDTKEACGSYIWNEQTYTTSGDYTFHTTNAAGCDSTATLHLTIKQPTSSENTKSACGSYIWNEQTYTTSGDYTFHTTNAAGCDSTATLHLTIKQPTSSEDNQEACGSYIWNEQTYTTSGDYTFHTTNAAGCDSTATLHLTIKQPTSSEETKSACNSYVWHDQTYTTSGDYTFHTTNAAGCDSTVTLHLTINECAITYDTVYYCIGQNTEHEELIEETLIRRFLPYEYESPATWDFMEGVILVHEHDRMQVDLHRAEQNLMQHYTDGLTPVKSIAWSYRPDGESSYKALEMTAEPQWIASGVVAVTVRFVCGQLYSSDFEADIVTVNGERSEVSGQKMLIDGQIVIIRGGKKYNIFGLEL